MEPGLLGSSLALFQLVIPFTAIHSCAELWSAEAGQAGDPRVWVGGRGANMNHEQRVGVQEN